MTAARIHWPELLVAAADIVDSYKTGVTLRQLFYRLVAAKLLPNTTSAYKGLSSKTAEARRQGEFPDLIDRGRLIHRRAHWASPAEALQALARQYRQDRTEGQDVSVYIGVEKAGLVMQLESWFGDLGIPILALGGYSSQTYVDDVVADVEDQDRPAVLLYSGDFDPSGEDIDRDFAERTDCFDKVVRVALSAEQVESYALPPAMGKRTDSRAGAFVARHGALVQVELDALPPDQLEALYRDAVAEFWDVSAYQAVRQREHEARAVLLAAVAGAGGGASTSPRS
jgi:hypothetical protein